MKKYLIIFLILVAGGILYFYSPFGESENIVTSDKNKFVSISGKAFIKDGKPFYPVTINYIVAMQTDRKNLWPCPAKSYNTIFEKFSAPTKDACKTELLADMQLIKEMGFNSVRIIGIGDAGVDDDQTGELYIRASIGNEKDTTIMLSNNEIYAQYFNAVEELLQIMDSVDLKGILLSRVMIDVKNI